MYTRFYLSKNSPSFGFYLLEDLKKKVEKELLFDEEAYKEGF